jgi:hypothetical protein
MTITGSLPPASIHGTWSENIEVWDVDIDALADLSGLTEIVIKLRDPRTRFDELTMKLSDGSVVIPSTGIIQWRAEAATMGRLVPKLYEVIMLLEDADNTVPFVLGPISIVE